MQDVNHDRVGGLVLAGKHRRPVQVSDGCELDDGRHRRDGGRDVADVSCVHYEPSSVAPVYRTGAV